VKLLASLTLDGMSETPSSEADIFLRLLGSGTAEQQINAAEALGRLHEPRAIEAFKLLVHPDGDPSLLLTITRALARIQDEESLCTLLRLSRGSYSTPVRVEALEALRSFDDPRVGEVLQQALDDVNRVVSRQADRILKLRAVSQN
jgi:HEAT repeat protein